MPKTVKFLTECAGRNKGVVETVNDDTLAQSWVDAKLAEFVPAPPADPAAKTPKPGAKGPAPEHKEKSPEHPPVDRAVRSAPNRR